MAKFQAIHSRGYKGHMQAWQRNYLVDKEGLFQCLLLLIKIQNQNKWPNQTISRNKKAGWNIAQKDSSPLYTFIQYLGAESVNIIRGTD